MQPDMRLIPRAFASAASITAALVFTACAVLVALAPQFATSVFSNAIHLNLAGLTRTLTWTTYFEGLFFWAVTAAVVFAVLARLYNSLVANRETTRNTVPGLARTADTVAPLPH